MPNGLPVGWCLYLGYSGPGLNPSADLLHSLTFYFPRPSGQRRDLYGFQHHIRGAILVPDRKLLPVLGCRIPSLSPKTQRSPSISLSKTQMRLSASIRHLLQDTQVVDTHLWRSESPCLNRSVWYHYLPSICVTVVFLQSV